MIEIGQRLQLGVDGSQVVDRHAQRIDRVEQKHGPQAVISDGLPVVVIATCEWNDADSRVRYERTLANIKEVKARGATIVALVSEGDREARARLVCKSRAQFQAKSVLGHPPKFHQFVLYRGQ